MNNKRQFGTAACIPTPFNSLWCLLARRAVTLDIDSLNVITNANLARAFEFAAKCPSHDALAWLKTVTNGWCTSTRMHEAIILRCIFGCKDKKDDLTHYLECTVLWSLIDEVFVGCVAPSKSGRINYIQPSVQNVCLISVAFEVYHALKIGLRDTVACAVSTLRFAEIAKVASKLISEKYERNVRLFRVYPEGETPSEAADRKSTR